MTDEIKTYEDFVLQAGEVKRDLDVVYNPTMGAIKKAFFMIFGSTNMAGSDFKRLSDMMFYQGGRPNPDSPPKEHTLAVQVANLIRLEAMTGTGKFTQFLKAEGVNIDVIVGIDDFYAVSKDDEKKLLSAWEGAGIDESIPTGRKEALELLLTRSQNLQAEICDIRDGLVDIAENVEEGFKIKKGNFMKAVSLHALKLRSGAGKMGEKLDDVVDGAENLLSAVEPLIKSTK